MFRIDTKNSIIINYKIILHAMSCMTTQELIYIYNHSDKSGPVMVCTTILYELLATYQWTYTSKPLPTSTSAQLSYSLGEMHAHLP